MRSPSSRRPENVSGIATGRAVIGEYQHIARLPDTNILACHGHLGLHQHLFCTDYVVSPVSTHPVRYHPCHYVSQGRLTLSRLLQKRLH